MTAAHHATDANAEALRLTLALQDLCDNAKRGMPPTVEQLSDLRHRATRVQYHTARMMHAVASRPVERRELSHA